MAPPIAAFIFTILVLILVILGFTLLAVALMQAIGRAEKDTEDSPDLY